MTTFPCWIFVTSHTYGARAWKALSANDLPADGRDWFAAESVSELIHTALDYRGLNDLEIYKLAKELIAEEIGLRKSDWQSVAVALGGAAEYYPEADEETVALAQDKLARPLADYRAAKAVSEKASAARATCLDEARKTYDARVAAWEAGMSSLDRSRLDGARQLVASLSGKARKRAKRKLRDLEKRLGRPDYEIARAISG